MHKLQVKFSHIQYQTMNEFETLRNCNVFGMQKASSSSLYYKNVVVLSYSFIYSSSSNQMCSRSLELANCIVLKVAKVDFVIAIHCIARLPAAVRERSQRSSNGTHFKSGYVVIMRKDTSESEDLQRRGEELGQVHGVIYRKAFGESCKHKNVVGL